MPQISKVERNHDIKQVSRLDDLKPATEKAISMATPHIRGKPQINETQQNLQISANAARRASIAAIRHAKTISDSSDKNEDQEAIDKIEVSARNAAADAAKTALDTKDSIKRQIRKKRPDIKNTKDIKSNVRTIHKADRSIKSATEATQLAVKTATQASKEAAIASTKVATARKAERLAKKSAEWVKKIVKGIVDAIKRLCAALGAASVPLVLILVLAASIAALVASAFGIFFAGDKTNTASRPLKEVVLEINSEYTSMLISDFLKKFHYSNTRVIDIEDFVTRYLGTTILYEDFAVDVPGRGGFISDGEQALPVLRNGMRQFVIFPENVIVIDSSLNSMDNLAKYRFTVAHEAAHFIMCKHVGGDFTAAFHTEYVDGEYYTTEMLKEMMSFSETVANRAAACLLMPDFIVEKMLNKYNLGNKVTIYTGSRIVIPKASKTIIQQMADSMGVSFSTCYYRLQELSILDKRPLEEYASAFSVAEDDYV